MSFYPKLIVVLILDIVNAWAAGNSHGAFVAGETTAGYWWLLLSAASIGFAGYMFIKLLNEKITVIVNAFWIALGALNVALVGFLVFGETLDWLQILGMVAIVAGLIIVEATTPDEEEVDGEVSLHEPHNKF